MRNRFSVTSELILTLIEQDIGPPLKRSGRYLWWRCPFHDDRSPSLGVTPDNGRWHCFGCGKSGDAITWLQEYRKMSWKEISLNHAMPHVEETLNRPALENTAPQKPGVTWQNRAKNYCIQWQETLWSPVGKQALNYLRQKRGLQDETIRQWGLGFNPNPQRDSKDLWGLHNRENPVYLPSGISIPWYVEEQIWKVNFRRNGEPKYLQIPGGSPAIFGLETLPGKLVTFIVEGEFDCMLLAQEISDLAGVCTLGSASGTLKPEWYSHFLGCRRIYVLGDADHAGQEMATRLGTLSKRVQPIQLPYGKDITEFWQGGGDLQGWVESLLS